MNSSVPWAPPTRLSLLPPESAAVLDPFFEAAVLGVTELHLISSVARLCPEAGPLDLLALGVASRGARHGHTCTNIADARQLTSSAAITVDGEAPPLHLPWPAPHDWSSALESSPIVARPDDTDSEAIRPLVFDGELIYLQRYWTHETRVADELRRRAAISSAPSRLEEVLDSLFGPSDDAGSAASQRQAVGQALSGGISIITGGPGTGKTYTIARILAGAHQLAESLGPARAQPHAPTHTNAHAKPHNVALAAPTGKAAARITESVGDALDSIADFGDTHRESEASTIHALLGWAPGDGFRHDRRHPLPHDMVIVDEASMVSVSLMARLLDALRPEASLVLVGDPDQLASVEVGTVLSDIIGPSVAPQPDTGHLGQLAERITVLARSHRFGQSSPIGQLASSIRAGRAEPMLELLASTSSFSGETDNGSVSTMSTASSISWIDPHDPDGSSGLKRLIDDVIESAVLVAEAALAGDAAAGIRHAMSTKVLAAVHHAQFGLHHWNDLIENAVGERVADFDNSRPWFIGRPVIITANDRVNRVSNGDIGLTVAHHGSLAVALPAPDGIRFLPVSRLSEAQTWWAMTIHMSQGSEFDHAVVSLPSTGSRVLSRELLYTAVTRARSRVTIIAGEEALRSAIDTPIARASGLRSRLWPRS